MTKLYQEALMKQNTARPPVWFMRQAGRYHAHYQKLRKEHGFVDLCKVPSLACETTMGPIRDFDFDAAILFSDILFPLESMGMGLRYDPAPQFDHLLRDRESVQKLRSGAECAKTLGFQAEALELLKKSLPPEKGLIGFVGSPMTLYAFAVEGSHKHGLSDAMNGIEDGRFEDFMAKLMPVLIEQMAMQARVGIDALAIFDSCAGDLSRDQFRQINVPLLRVITDEMKQRFPELPLLYYGKGIAWEQWSMLEALKIDALGVDWNVPLAEVLEKYADRWSIQGNFDPHLLRDTPVDAFEAVVRDYFAKIPRTQKLRSWVCGLGHGVLPLTPEANVRTFLRVQKEVYG